MDHPRIVSLIASATEIVCALGLGDRLVGRSHECDYPASVLRLPVCSAPRIAANGSSAAIDRLVKQSLREALSVYRIDGATLRGLRPDLIVTQSLCEVCAVSLGDVERAVSEWIDARARIVSLGPARLADVWDDIGRVAEACGAAERGKTQVRRLRGRIDTIAARFRAAGAKPRVACIEWIDPLMAAGNWTPELVALAGGINLFGAAGRHAPWMTWEDLRDADPDLVVVMPCGFDVGRTRREMPALTSRPGWDRLRAVGAGRVVLADGSQYFNRPGPRLVESLEILAEVFHPEAVRYGHEGGGWQRL